MKIYNLAFLLLFLFPLASNEAVEFPASSPITDGQQKLNTNKSGAVNLTFKSIDGGQTWQDISEGLPENLQGDAFFSDDRGLFLRAGIWMYHSKPNSTAPFWNKEIFPDEHGIYAYNYNGQFSQKINGTSVSDFQKKGVHTVFETAGGSVFIGTDNGIFKSTNSGKAWKQVNTGGWVMKLVESNGVLLATSQGGILRSADDGENWDLVISEGGVGIAVERIKGGFAAITYSTQSKTRRVRTSYDRGKTWEAIDERLPADLSIASIIQVGEDLFCGHPNGIFRSSDKGQTWKLLLPSIGLKVFNLSTSGNVIYAIARDGGC